MGCFHDPPPMLVLTWAECHVAIALPQHVNVCVAGGFSLLTLEPRDCPPHLLTAVVTDTS